MAHLYLCCCVQHIPNINAESLMQKTHSLCSLCTTAHQPYIQRRIIVSLNMQTSQSIVGAPWAEMMCKIAFLEACRPGEEASWNRHITSSTGRLFKWKISIYSAQESSTLNPILPGFLFRLLSRRGVHANTHTRPNRKHTDTHTQKA